VVPDSFYDFFQGCATVAGALIGLLFVALSVARGRMTGHENRTQHDVRAAAAFSALINTLVIALTGLLPGTSFGEVGIVVACAGLATTAGLIIVLYRERQGAVAPGDVRMLAILLLLYVLQLANAVLLAGTPRDVNAVARQGGLAILFFLFSIARSWQLVGARNVSLVSSVTEVIRGPAQDDQEVQGPPGDGQA
jgi:hypothetical protein